MQHDIQLGRSVPGAGCHRVRTRNIQRPAGETATWLKNGRSAAAAPDPGGYFYHIEGVAGREQHRECRACPPIIDISGSVRGGRLPPVDRRVAGDSGTQRSKQYRN